MFVLRCVSSRAVDTMRFWPRARHRAHAGAPPMARGRKLIIVALRLLLFNKQRNDITE